MSVAADFDLRFVSAVLERHPEVLLGFVFGSLAQGTAGRDSDLDVAVAGRAPLNRDEKIGLIEELAAACGRPVDLLDLNAVDGMVLGQVLQHGRLLVKRDPGLYAWIIHKAVYYDADEMPYRRRILEERRQAWTNR